MSSAVNSISNEKLVGSKPSFSALRTKINFSLSPAFFAGIALGQKV